MEFGYLRNIIQTFLAKILLEIVMLPGNQANTDSST